MKGGGFYDAHSNPQRLALEPYVDWLVDALGSWRAADDGPIRLLDIGSSEGGNAIYAQNRIVEALRTRTERAIQPILSDLPTSDYASLARNVFPASTSAFLQEEVYPALTAGSAYKRLAPPNSIHIATTFNMLGWLSRRPPGGLDRYVAAISPSPYATDADYAVTSEDTAEIDEQARRDLEAFFRARAQEIPPGGLLLAQCFGTGPVHSTAHGFSDVLHDALIQLVGEDTVPDAVRRAFFLPVAYRTLDALLRPVEDGDSFEVLKADTLESPVGFNVSFETDWDLETWARAYTNFVRAFTEAILADAFRSSGADEGLVDPVYDRMEALLRADPERYRFRYISVGALLKRR